MKEELKTTIRFKLISLVNRYLLNSKIRDRGVQFFIILVLGIIFYLAITNLMRNLENQNMAMGFGFLSQVAGFEVSESLINYSSEDSYRKALLSGLLNTLKVALIGNIFAVVIGIIIGVLRISKNYILSTLAGWYIEVFRNLPLLLQLFFWYALFTDIFPGVRQALNPLPGMFLSNRGLVIPVLKEVFVMKLMGIGFIFSLIFAYFYLEFFKKVQVEKGGSIPLIFPLLIIIFGIPFSVWGIMGFPSELEYPVLRGFNFNGGLTFTPEYTSLLLGLVLYTAAFIAEIVRSGILSVNKGQIEAANALGLRPKFILLLVVLPQSVRIIIPPLTGQLLNLTKNSSLAVAIAYPDFVSIANTSLNQTGQAVEIILLIVLVYLTFSIATSVFMNWYNKKVSLIER